MGGKVRVLLWGSAWVSPLVWAGNGGGSAWVWGVVFGVVFGVVIERLFIVTGSRVDVVHVLVLFIHGI